LKENIHDNSDEKFYDFMNGIVHYTSNQNEDEIPEYLDFKYYVKLYLENNENKIN